jgi:hypothetical protein
MATLAVLHTLDVVWHLTVLFMYFMIAMFATYAFMVALVSAARTLVRITQKGEGS